ncbi:periplasmic heavy metal sensor [Marinibacterium profundimaris]|uniref:Heavy-metal resistance n=1 Tax=Marinibacterium profundimaris TaxID=1679460 RepID=A0A225ND38_9RHOB|nr:periplasmic heavy metal sensor [Marinibacterium profundimaris]OWU69020.1 hypothetical protein ATO3_23235 [Marinibacterium profundimaris]
MPDPASRPAAPGTKPWLRVVLGLSLMLNLLIVGLVLGAVIRFGGPGERPPPPTGVAMFRALPSDDRRAMRDHLREALLPPSDRRSEAEDLAEVLSADPLDDAALLSVLDQHAARREAFQQELRQAWLGHVTTMTADERAAYAERLVEFSDQHRHPEHGREDR